jgi:hypothetical protein
MSFVEQCNIFRTFTFFFFGNLMKQSSDDELKVNILGRHGLQTLNQIIKKWGKVYHVHVFIFNLHLKGM